MTIAFTQEVTPTKHLVKRYHNFPEMLTDEEKEGSISIDTPPETEFPVGKVGVLYCNPETGNVWYEYVDRPLTEIEQLRQQLIEQQQLIDTMLGVSE